MGEERWERRDGRGEMERRDGEERWERRDGRGEMERRDGEERWERRDGEERWRGEGESNIQSTNAHTCLHSVRLLFPSMALACREVGTTGSASAERKVRRAAAAENTVPGSSLPPLSNTSWMSCSSAWRPPSVNRSSCKR